MYLSDEVILDGTRKTGDGYLVARARVARTGIQLYKGYELGRPEMDTVRVYRPEKEVFSRDALHSFAHKPITLEHPRDLVNSSNWKDHAIGKTGEEVARDGEFIRVPMLLCDAQAIAAIEGGKRELSMGYTCDVKFKDGVTPQGEKYDAIQTNIRGNHLAVVSAARGGPMLKIGDRGKEPIMNELKTIVVDGLDVQVTEATSKILQKHLDGMSEAIKKAAEKEKEAKDALALVATKDAEIATLKQQLADAQLKPEQLDAMVQARVSTIAKAKAVLGDKLVIDGKTDADIRRQVVSSKMGDVCKDWDDKQVEASFNTLTVGAEVKTDALATVIRNGVSPNAGVTDARDKAYADNIQRLQGDWKRRPSAAA